MIKQPPTHTNWLINVTLKDGTEYLGKDIPQAPFGQHDKVVSFWEGESLMIIPMTEVKHTALYFK